MSTTQLATNEKTQSDFEKEEIIRSTFARLQGESDHNKVASRLRSLLMAYDGVDDGDRGNHTTRTGAEWGEDERAQRDADVGTTIMTGIRFLDEVMDGISRRDLVIIAAATGAGKSQMCAEIARYASQDGSPTFLLALEAYAGEMERRLKWPILCRLYRAANPAGKDLDWVKFSHSRYQDVLRPFEDKAQKEFAEKYGALNTLYRDASTFGIKEMEREIVRASEIHKLTLLDHLHYVDTDSDDRNVNEYGMQKKIVQKLRELTLAKGKPIIAAAHFSKLDTGKNAPILPPMQKIMGSSDISKIATQVIILGNTSALEEDAFPFPLRNVPGMAGTSPTLVQLAKGRIAGSDRSQYAAVCYYDRREGKYRPQYLLGRLRGYGTKWVPVYEDEIDEWASWAESAIRLPRPAPTPPKGDK